MSVIVVVERLSAHRSDGRERQTAPVCPGHCLQCGSRFVFLHADAQHPHGFQMHFCRHVASPLNLHDFLLRLVIPQVDNPFDKRYGRHFHSRLHTQQIHQFQPMLGTVGRQIMHHPFLCHYFLHIHLQFCHWPCFHDSYPLRFLVQSGLRTHPHNMVDGQFIAKIISRSSSMSITAASPAYDNPQNTGKKNPAGNRTCCLRNSFHTRRFLKEQQA